MSAPLIHGEIPAVREFQEWLNDRRMLPVSAVFHEIVVKYRAAALDTQRLDFIEANPDKSLRLHKKRWALIGFTNYPFEVFGRLRDAIDHAIKGYPE